jgi:hypothetical protein
MTIKDAENEWIMMNRQSSLSNINLKGGIDSTIEYYDLSNQNKSLKNLNISSNQTFDSGISSNNSDFDLTTNNNQKLISSKLRLNNNIHKSSSSNLTDQNGEDLQNNFVNSRSNSAVSTKSGKNANSELINRDLNNNNTNNQSNKKSLALNNGSNIIEDGCTMFFYGNKSLDVLEIKIDQNLLNQIINLSFHFIDYGDFLSRYFTKLRNKFCNVTVRENIFL